MSTASDPAVDAAVPRPPDSTLLIRLSTLLWALLVLCWLAALPVLLGVSWLSLPGLLVVAALLALPLSWLWRRLWRPARARAARATWARTSLGLWCLCCALAAAPIYYLAIIVETRPAIVPTVTLRNGPRTVVLQGMQHVGADRFYQAVVYDLEKALSEGYVLAYEGVANSDPEADAWFRKTLSQGADLGDHYRELSRTCGLSYQIDWFGPLVADAKQHPERHVTIDVDTRAMKVEYDRLMAADPSFAAAMRRREAEQAEDPDGTADLLARMLQPQASANPRRETLTGTLCRGLMTYVMRQASQGGGELDPVVLHLRNRHLARQLLTDTRPRLYVTYGAAHLPGVLALMQREPGWQVASIKWMRTIAAPEHLEGRL